MASLSDLLRGEKSAVDEIAARGALMRRDGEVLEICDAECRTLLGFQPGRGGLLVYYVDAESRSFETLIVDDLLVLSGIELSDVVEEGGVVRAPSIWIHIGDPGLRYTRGRICEIRESVKCKSL